MSTKKDNSTFHLKARLRRNLRKEFGGDLVVMETHGGFGALYDDCYSDVKTGIVFDKDEEKARHLASQRPEWAVYKCDTVGALKAGVGSWLDINFLDADPYGSPWPTLTAFFESDREFPQTLCLAVNDGLRQKLAISGGWDVEHISQYVEMYGRKAIYPNYLDICQDLLKKTSAQRGYSLSRWAGYYCGHGKQMTHYAAILTRASS